MNLATILASNAAGRPDHPALIGHGAIVTHAEAFEQAGALAARLRDIGVRKGHRVGL